MNICIKRSMTSLFDIIAIARNREVVLFVVFFRENLFCWWEGEGSCSVVVWEWRDVSEGVRVITISSCMIGRSLGHLILFSAVILAISCRSLVLQYLRFRNLVMKCLHLIWFLSYVYGSWMHYYILTNRMYNQHFKVSVN